MSAKTSRVKSILNERTGDSDETRESSGLSKDDVREAARQGVDEALDDRERTSQSDETDGSQTEVDDESSGGRRSMKSLLFLGGLASLGYLFRRRRKGASGTGSEESESN